MTDLTMALTFKCRRNMRAQLPRYLNFQLWISEDNGVKAIRNVQVPVVAIGDEDSPLSLDAEYRNDYCGNFTTSVTNLNQQGQYSIRLIALNGIEMSNVFNQHTGLDISEVYSGRQWRQWDFTFTTQATANFIIGIDIEPRGGYAPPQQQQQPQLPQPQMPHYQVGDNTALYVVGALAGVAIIGTIIYAMTRKEAR